MDNKTEYLQNKESKLWEELKEIVVDSFDYKEVEKIITSLIEVNIELEELCNQ